MNRFWVSALVGATLTAGQASAACWTPRELAAAQVRNLDTMLMVASLGCRTFDRGVAARYNDFVDQDRATLIEANAVLRAHFAREFGQVDGAEAYDDYVTKVANRFGGGVNGLDCGDFARITADALDAPSSFEALSEVASGAQIEPVLDDALCGPASETTFLR